MTTETHPKCINTRRDPALKVIKENKIFHFYYILLKYIILF